MRLSRLQLILILFPAVIIGSNCREATSLNIIPQPLSVSIADSNFVLKPDTRIFLPEGRDDWAVAAQYFAALCRQGTGFELADGPIRPTANGPEPNAIYFLPDEKIAHPEGYKLEITTAAILIRAGTAAGAFYAVQTLRQLFPPEFNANTPVAPVGGITWAAPCCTVEDAPRFAYRGLHLDVGRHFFPVAFIKKYIDLLAAHKLNTFHWHLTDDQGWRIEIKKFPELQTVASCRKQTLIGHYSDQPPRFDSIPHCGFYTQDEVREVVEYARQRFVTIIPEIEMPGHAMAALAAYPELGCTGGPYEVATTWGIYEDVFCAGNEKTFEFVEGVLDEVCALFPGDYIHIGGDECPKTRWEACPKCRDRMAKDSLHDGHALQSYFIHRAEEMLNRRGKKLIGWDEILEGGLAPSATVMSWRGMEGGVAAARAGHDAVMTPGSHLYFDYYQSDPATEPLAIGGFLPLEKAYGFEPVPPELGPGETQHILGAQANVWTEYIATPDAVEYMAYPRVCALAEVVWSAAEKKNWPDFARRLQVHFRRLDAMGVRYARSFYDVAAAFSKGRIRLSAIDPDLQIRYTTDGSDPTPASAVFDDPFAISRNTTVKAAVFENGVQMGKVRTVHYLVHKASGKPYTLQRVPDKYTGGETYGLTNGITGHIKSWDHWVGLVNRDIDPVIDLGEPTEFSRVTTQFVNDKSSWIYPPRSVEIYVSDDAQNFTLLASRAIPADTLRGVSVEKVQLDMPGAKGRYLKFVARTFGVIPADAPGAGNGAWCFIDEVVVE